MKGRVCALALALLALVATPCVEAQEPEGRIVSSGIFWASPLLPRAAESLGGTWYEREPMGDRMDAEKVVHSLVVNQSIQATPSLTYTLVPSGASEERRRVLGGVANGSEDLTGPVVAILPLDREAEAVLRNRSDVARLEHHGRSAYYYEEGANLSAQVGVLWVSPELVARTTAEVWRTLQYDTWYRALLKDTWRWLDHELNENERLGYRTLALQNASRGFVEVAHLKATISDMRRQAGERTLHPDPPTLPPEMVSLLSLRHEQTRQEYAVLADLAEIRLNAVEARIERAMELELTTIHEADTKAEARNAKFAAIWAIVFSVLTFSLSALKWAVESHKKK